MSWRICTRSMGLAECRAAFSWAQASYHKLDESVRLCGQQPRFGHRIDSDGLAFPALSMCWIMLSTTRASGGSNHVRIYQAGS